MTASIAIVHWVETFQPGGVSAVIEGLMELCSDPGDRIVYSPCADSHYVDDLRRRGLLTHLITDYSKLLELIHERSIAAVVIHSGGESTAGRDHLFEVLTNEPQCPLIELNVFGFVDDRAIANRIDLHLFNSTHTMWRHWVTRGRPSIPEYLRRHRTLYNPVTLDVSDEKLVDLRASGRARLSIPEDAFVIGDVCRPDAGKLDNMLAAITPLLDATVGPIHVVTQCFPDLMAVTFQKAIGARYHNLPFAMNRHDLIETYAVMDVFAHFSTMGESFGMAVAEAMRCGLPVVANETPRRTQNNAQLELIVDRQTGFFANGPYIALQRLIELAKSPELRHRFGKAGRSRFTVPPLAPDSIARQLTSEVVRLAAYKGVPVDGLPKPIERVPSLAEDQAYLSTYRPRYTEHSLLPVPMAKVPSIWNMEASRVWWRVKRRYARIYTAQQNAVSPITKTEPISGTATKLTVIHWVQNLTPGGGLSVLEGFASQAGTHEEHILSAPRVDLAYMESIRDRATSTRIITDETELLCLVRNCPAVAMVFHSGGEQSAERDRLLQALVELPHCCVLERNIFGFVDHGPAAQRIDLHMFNSMHTMWRHWVAQGRPQIREYLVRHRTLYNPVTLVASATDISAFRTHGRTRLCIPNNAFVIGDICRPDPRKLDYMLAAIAPRLEREIGPFHVVTQRFPDNIASVLRDTLGKRYHNLPFSMDRENIIETYAIMDVFAHFSTMGESFGMALAEAMQCGLPVIANETPNNTQNNAQPELIINGRTGLFANDPLTAMQRLIELAKSKDLRRRLGDAGRARFTVPPLDPALISLQLTSEIVRLIKIKGVDFDRPPSPVTCIPSMEDQAAYLQNYHPGHSAPSINVPLTELPWLLRAETARLWWRIRRRHLS